MIRKVRIKLYSGLFFLSCDFRTDQLSSVSVGNLWDPPPGVDRTSSPETSSAFNIFFPPTNTFPKSIINEEEPLLTGKMRSKLPGEKLM